jgi:GTPase SAR1 family protein
MNAIDPLFIAYHQKRTRLREVVQSARNLFQSLEMRVSVDATERLASRLDAESLKVLVVGQFKQGKSTLINAMLGEEVLPAFAVPCTAVINEIKYGDTCKALVHFRNPLPERLPTTLSEVALKHIRKHAPNVPPIEIGVQELQDYVVIPDPAKDHSDSVAESPFSLVEIYWPIDLCRNGVEIIDSPGLNEHGTRTRVTTDYLTKVDAIVFVLSCLQLAGQKEIEFVEDNLRAAGHEEIIFACNRIDQVRAREREKLIAYGRSRLEPLTNLRGEGVFFVSAADGLEGRVEKDPELLRESGLLELEGRLARFLVDSRGRLKLLQPARQLLIEVNRAIAETIPSQIDMLSVSVDDLRKRYDSIQPHVNETTKRCENVLSRVKNGRERLREDVLSKVELFMRQVADNVTSWAELYELRSEFKVVTFESSDKQAKTIANEVAEYLNERVSREYTSWSKTELLPLIERKVKEITASVESSLDEIVADIDLIKRLLNPNISVDHKGPSGVERLLAGGLGFVIGGAGSGYVGATMGTMEMLKSLGPAMAILIGSLLLGITNPFVLIGLLFGGGFLQSFLKAKDIASKIKMSTAEKLAAQLKVDARNCATKAADVVHEKTSAIQEAIALSVKNELRGVEELIASVLSEKEAGEARCEQRRKFLEDSRQKLRIIQKQLDDLIFDHALPGGA